MAVWDLYSKRQKQLRGETPDVYTYDEIPDALAVQIVHIWHDTLGDSTLYLNGQSFFTGTYHAYKEIVDILRRERGEFTLPCAPSYKNRGHLSELVGYLMQETEVEKALDVIELTFRCIDQLTRKHEYLRLSPREAEKRADDAIAELNKRFREHGVGYQFCDGMIVRIDSEFVHAEVVKPALALLRAADYAGAQAEFLNAHEHYRHGRMKEALQECLKAFESVMKIICAKRHWPHPANATSSALIQVLFEKDLIPPFWQSHFSGLRSSLEGGVPTARNKLGGHGQGTEVVDVPNHLVAYVLHMTASAIVYLAEAEKALP